MRALSDANAIRDKLTSGCPAPLEANLVGEIRHRKVIYPSLREPIVEPAVWQRVQEMLNQKAAHPRGRTVSRTTSLLMGRLFDENGEPLYSCWAKKRGAPLPLLRLEEARQRIQNAGRPRVAPSSRTNRRSCDSRRATDALEPRRLGLHSQTLAFLHRS